MKFLYVAPRFHPNQYPIVEGLLSKGHEVYFCVSKIGETEKHKGVKIEKIKPSSKTVARNEKWLKHGTNYAEDKLIFWFEPDYNEMMDYLKKINPDIVIIRDRNMFSLLTVRICRKLSIKKVLLYNQSPVWSAEEPFGKQIQKKIWFSLFPKKRITTCEYRLYPPKDDEKLIYDANAYYLPFVPRLREKIDRSYLQNGIINVLDCGKYREYKNHILLIEAAKILVEREYKNFHLTILGQAINSDEVSYYELCKEMVCKYRLTEFVSLKNCVPYDQVPEYYLKNDLFILPSKSEQASVSCLDSMSFGLATISTSRNGTASYITPGKTGEIFETNNVKDLANKIEIYLKKPELIQLQGKAALSDIEDTFGFEKYYKKLMKIIEEL